MAYIIDRHLHQLSETKTLFLTLHHVQNTRVTMSLANLGRKKFISQAALSSLLNELKELPELPEATSRSSVKRARDGEMQIQTPLGPLIINRELKLSSGEGTLDAQMFFVLT